MSNDEAKEVFECLKEQITKLRSRLNYMVEEIAMLRKEQSHLGNKIFNLSNEVHRNKVFKESKKCVMTNLKKYLSS